MDSDNIKVGQYIIIQRQKYTKLYKFNSLDAVTALGKDQIELRNINDQAYFTTFRMVPKTLKGKRLMSLEVSTDVQNLSEKITVPVTESGADNRNLKDTTDSQALSHEEILKLRDSGSSASDIVGQIVENSKTFASKTEYSQNKYLRRKEKKYFEYLQIRRPTIRLISEIMYRRDADKIMGLRIDSLSQLVSYSGISSSGNYLLFESGTNGLVPAVLLNSIGANTEAKLLHMHQGNFPQKQAVFALNLADEQLERYVCVNLYSVLRHYYQQPSTKRKIGEDDADGDNPPAKLAKLEDTVDSTDQNDDEMKDAEPTDGKDEANNTEAANGDGKTPKWVQDNERACELLRQNLDGLIIVAKEHPTTILNALF